MYFLKFMIKTRFLILLIVIIFITYYLFLYDD